MNAPNTNIMLELNNLRLGYGPCAVIDSVSLHAQGGELIGLLGPNGSGKSTLLKALAHILAPMSGDILLSGVEISTLPRHVRAKRIAYLSQARETAPGMRVLDAVSIGRAPHRGPLGRFTDADKSAVTAAMARTHVSHMSERALNSLSGGELARVLLARALAVNADILLADEPTAALDPRFQIDMMTCLKDEAQNGKLVMCAVHDLALAHEFCDRVWVLHRGQCVADGPPAEALSPRTLGDVYGIRPPKGGFSSVSIIPNS